MCVGIPMQVIEGGATHARCRDPHGAEAVIDLLLTGPQPQGAWLMTFLGAARAVLDEGEAQRSLAAVRALDTLLAGGTPDLDAAFADLVDHSPQLPDFLRPSH